MIETRLSPSGGFSVRGHEVVGSTPSFTYTAGICTECGAECVSQVVSYNPAHREGHARCWECHHQNQDGRDE